MDGDFKFKLVKPYMGNQPERGKINKILGTIENNFKSR